MKARRNIRMATRHRAWYVAIATAVIVLALAVGCGQIEPTATSVPPSATTAPPTATSVPPDTPLPTNTPVPTTAPSATATVPPTETPAPTITPSPEPTAEPFQVIRDVAYVAGGDPAQTLTIYLPDAEYQTSPTLFVLGGEWMPDLVHYFVTRGHAVVSVSMRGDNFMAETQDGFCALAWTLANAQTYGLDPASVVPVGVSMWGGSVALLGAVDDATPFLESCPHSLPETGRVQGIVALAGVFDYSEATDFFDGFIASISGFMGGMPDENPEAWAQASAVTWVDGSEPPFLLVHGTADVNVDVHQSELFQALLEEAGVEVELVLIRGTDHRGIISDDRVFEAMQAFLEQLTAQPPAVTPEPAAADVTFVDSGQALGSARSWDVSLGDLDGDGDLDAFVANDTPDEGNAVWLNGGDGSFSLSEQDLGRGQSVALGDLDGDGDLDALATQWWPERPSVVWLNAGGLQGGTPGVFAEAGELGGGGGSDAALGDLDGDGDLDAFIAHLQANAVWLNDGTAVFSDSGQRLGEAITADVELGDLDGDGDLDALAGGWDEPATVWLNDGTGVFSAHDQTLSPANVHIHGAALGDVEGDGDLDAFFVIASGHPNQVWLNDGRGTFTDSGQGLRAPLAHGLALGDLDGDGALDALTSHGDRQGGSGIRLWLNDGSGQFADSSVRLGDGYSMGVGLGDLDGDGDLDAFVTHGVSWQDSGGGLANKVWLNETATAPAPDQLVVEAPPGIPPSLDGTLSPDEWSGARAVGLADGSELLLMHDGDYLYLAIRASVPGLGSICLDRGNQVAVLHSSAALGTAVYEKGDAGWQRTQSFSWTCRDTTMTEQALEERARHLQSEGWVASNALMGSGTQMEYQIKMSEGSLRLAVTYLPASGNQDLIWWPVGLDDDCHKLELAQGYTPTPLQFSPETWLTIVAVTALEAGEGPVPPPSGGSGELIAFYSERDGDAEIYIMNVDAEQGSRDQRPLTDNDAHDMCPAWSPDGTQLVFLSDRNDANPVTCFPHCNYEIYVMNVGAEGSPDQRRLTENDVYDGHPAWSPDGAQIAFVSQRDGENEIYVMDADGSNPVRLTDSPGGDMRPAWSPDGRQIAFNSERDGNWEIYVMNADGSNQRRLTDSPAGELFPAWSPDGSQIAFFLMRTSSRKQDIYVMNADGTDVRQLTDHPAVDEDPAWSPDGTQIVFQSDRDGNFEIYVMNADGSNQRRLTDDPGGDYWPAWQP